MYNLIKKICQYCSKEFFIFPSQDKAGRRKYCSPECHNKNRSAQKTGGTKVKLVCKNCGKEFYALAKEVNRGRKYCSRECTYASPELRAKMSAARKGKFVGPDSHRFGKHLTKEARAKLSEARKGNKTWLGKHHSAETKKKLSELHMGVKTWQGKHLSAEHKAKISDSLNGKYVGEKSPAWKGGKSFEPYCIKFNAAFKERIREKFNHACFSCDECINPKKSSCKSPKLHIHHIDYNKNSICNGHDWAFIPLCLRCHTPTNGNRWRWFNLFVYYWAMNPEINFYDEMLFPSCFYCRWTRPFDLPGALENFDLPGV